MVTSQDIATCSISRGFLSGAGSWCICEAQDGWIPQMMRFGQANPDEEQPGQGCGFKRRT